MLPEIVVGAPAPAPVPRQAHSDEQLIDLWLHGRSPHTQRAYRADTERLRGRAGKPLALMTLADLQDFAGSLDNLSSSSRYRILSATKSLLAFGHRIGYLTFDVGRVLRLPAVRNRLAERILPESDLRRILELEPGTRNRAILSLLYATGIRVSELCGLCWRDLQPNGEAGQISVFGKGGRTRSIQLPVTVWKLVISLRPAPVRPEDPVFRSRKTHSRKTGDDARLQSTAILTLVRKAARRAGVELPVSPHWFRHAHASHALDRGAPIHLVQATLGHASINTTGRYLHARPKESSGSFLAF